MKLTALLLVAMAGTAWADAPPVDCPRPKKKKVVKKRPPPKPCFCTGRQGPPGPQGPEGPKGDPGRDGRDGESRYILIEEKPDVLLDLRVGLLGTIQAPHNDWAWGPALQLTKDLSEDYVLNLTGGLAMGASDGREDGFILQLGVERALEDDQGLEVGVQYTSIEGSSNNGEIDGRYLTGFASVALKIKNLRLALGPTVGGLRDGFKDGTQFTVGAQASAFIGWR